MNRSLRASGIGEVNSSAVTSVTLRVSVVESQDLTLCRGFERALYLVHGSSDEAAEFLLDLCGHAQHSE